MLSLDNYKTINDVYTLADEGSKILIDKFIQDNQLELTSKFIKLTLDEHYKELRIVNRTYKHDVTIYYQNNNIGITFNKGVIANEELIMILEKEHPYYASQTNYCSNKEALEYDTFEEYLEAFGTADIDMNLIYRFDIQTYTKDELVNDEQETLSEYCDADGLYRKMQVTVIKQRKGIYTPVMINCVFRKDYQEIYNHLSRAYSRNKELWKGFE